MAKEKNNKENDTITIRVSKEFQEFCDEYAKKINHYGWHSLKISYVEVTTAIARRAIASGFLK